MYNKSVDKFIIDDNDVKFLEKWVTENLTDEMIANEEVVVPFSEIVIVLKTNLDDYRKSVEDDSLIEEMKRIAKVSNTTVKEVRKGVLRQLDKSDVEQHIYFHNGNFESYLYYVASKELQSMWNLSEDDILNRDSQDAHMQNKAQMIRTFMQLVLYINSTNNVETEEKIEKVGKKIKNSGKKSKNKNVVRFTKIVKRTHKIIKNPSVLESKIEYERHAESWNVRGHWRKYKSGKKIWIKPHIKGTGQNIEGKNYTL